MARAYRTAKVNQITPAIAIRVTAHASESAAHRGLGRSALPLPRYTLRKRLKDGNYGYFFNIPTWARKRGCSIANEALGTN
jgi:hypothetical protein